MGAVDPDLILETPCCRVQAHSQVLSLYCPRMASALDQPDQLVRDPESGLPIVQWCWPQEVEIPGALHPGCITIPATDAVLALLYLCYQHHQYAAGTEAPLVIGHVQAILGQSWYCVAVLAVVAQDFGWSDLLRMLDGMLAQLPGPILLGPGTIQFARQIHLRDTLRSAIRAGVVHDPVQLELQPVVTLGEISDALLSWSSPNVRFIDLVRCAAKLSLSPEQILRQVHEDQHFCITIESTDRLRYLLRWIRRINVWGFDFWNGWFSRCGYMIVERIKVQSSSKADQHDGVLMLKDLQSLLLDIVKNELICIPNPDRMFLGLDLSQCVFSPKLAVSAWRLPFA